MAQLRFRYHTAEGIVDGTAESPEELEAFQLAIPVQPPELWGAGVTYERSLDARVKESAVKDVYTLVYGAARPELFLKDAGCRRTRCGCVARRLSPRSPSCSARAARSPG